jgi:hypothetical protein
MGHILVGGGAHASSGTVHDIDETVIPRRMEVFPSASGGTVRMLEEEQYVAASIVLGMLLHGGDGIVNSFRMGEGISRGAVIAGGDMERLVKILHEVKEPS